VADTIRLLATHPTPDPPPNSPIPHTASTSTRRTASPRPRPPPRRPRSRAHRWLTPADPALLAQAASQIRTVRPASRTDLRCQDNRITDPATRIQIRYGPDRQWHPFAQTENDEWASVGPPASQAADAYRTALTATRASRTRP